MGKRSNKPRRTAKPGKARAQVDDSYMDKEMDDEIDAFHKQREMILLDVNKDAGESDDDLEEPVFDLEGLQNGENFIGREDDDEEDEDEGDENTRDFADVEDKGFAAKIARQAKYLKEKFGGGDDEMSDNDEQDEEIKSVWGRKKNLYYSADNIDYELQSSDEDLPMEEEAEVLRIQREKLKGLEMEDFGLADSDQEESDADREEKTFQMKQISLQFPSQAEITGCQIDESANKSNGETVSLELEPNLVDMSAKALTVDMTGLKDSAVDVDNKSATKKLPDSRRDLKSIEMMKIKKILEVKLKQKGIYSRIQGKVDKTLEDLAKPINWNNVTSNDFDDEVAHTKLRGPDNIHQGVNKLAQTAVTKAKGWKVVSGDDDLPKRDDIAERRRKHELRVLARAGVISTDDHDEDYNNPGINTVDTDYQENEEIESEDEFYRKVKKQRAEKITAKA